MTMVDTVELTELGGMLTRELRGVRRTWSVG